MNNETYWRDDIKLVFNGRREEPINEPKQIYGKVKKFFTNELYPNITFLEMDTGVIYYRYNIESRDKTSGWNYLHKLFNLTKEQNNEFLFLIAKHLGNIKYLTSQGNFKTISIEVQEFKSELVSTFSRLQVKQFFESRIFVNEILY